MSLTGAALLWLLVVATVASFAAVVWALPRASQPGPLAVLSRAGMVVGVNLLVLLTVATALNDRFAFFADWTDLRGALGAPAQFRAAQAGADPGHAAGVSVAPHRLAHPAVPPGALAGAERGERVLRFTVTGASTGVRGTIEVGLPPNYGAPANLHRSYPVMEAFSGYPGTPAQWFDAMDLLHELDLAAAAHRMGPVVVVSATTEVPPGVDTECVDGTGGRPQMETWLTADVPRWLSEHVRVRSDRASWTTIGLSAGGWCAAMATMLHPEQYAAGIVLGGYFAPDFPAHDNPFGDDTALARRYDLVALAHRAPPPVALWIQTSHSDRLSYPSTAGVLAAAKPPLSVSALVLNHAGHRMSLWQGLLPTVMTWLGSNIPGFRA